MKRFLNFTLPAFVHLLARRIFYLPVDAFDSITGRRPEGVPQRGKILVSYSEYLNEGKKYLTYFQELADLQPDYSVLEAGCGTGRIALPLIRFLNKNGIYNGLDEAESDINWCKKNISAKHPNFRFQYTGLKNKPVDFSSKADAEHFIFPYEDEKFDFVFITSAFTLLKPTEVENYINEIGRVMKMGAKCLISLYIVNCVSEDLMIKKPTQMHFPFNKGFYRLRSIEAGKQLIAYDEEWILEKLQNAGLKMASIQFGSWCGRKHFFDYQDLIICSKM